MRTVVTMTMMNHDDLLARASTCAKRRKTVSLAFGCNDAGGAPQLCCDGLYVPITMIAKIGDDDDDDAKNDDRRPAAFVERRFRL